MSRWSAVGLLVAVSGAAVGSAGACTSFSDVDTPVDAGSDASSVPPADATSDSPIARCDTTDLGRLATDPDNCGKCGHACLGGSCIEGACQPTVIATTTDVDAILDVAVDDENVLWTTVSGVPWSTSGNVYRCPKKGGVPAERLTDPTVPVDPGSLVADGTAESTFVSFDYMNHGIAPIHAKIDPLFATDVGFPAPTRLRLHGSKLYFLQTFGADASPSLAVEVVGQVATIVTTVPSNHVPDMIVTKDRVFLADNTTIYAAPIGGGPAAPYFMYTDRPRNLHSLATDESSVFWVTEEPPLGVAACPVDGCMTPMTVVTVAPSDTPAATTYAGGTLYTTTLNGDLFACPSTGCGNVVTPIVHGAQFFDGEEWRFGHNVAVDDVAIYYSEKMAGGHRLMKLAK